MKEFLEKLVNNRDEMEDDLMQLSIRANKYRGSYLAEKAAKKWQKMTEEEKDQALAQGKKENDISVLDNEILAEDDAFLAGSYLDNIGADQEEGSQNITCDHVLEHDFKMCMNNSEEWNKRKCDPFPDREDAPKECLKWNVTSSECKGLGLIPDFTSRICGYDWTNKPLVAEGVDRATIRKYMDSQRKYKNMTRTSLENRATAKVEIDNPDLKISPEIQKKLKKLIIKRKEIVQGLRDLWSTFVAILLILAIWNSYKYHKKYLTVMKNDNIYITDYFKKIDQRRRRAGKMTLLPIKESDSRPDLLDPLSAKLSAKEKSSSVKSFLLLFVFIVIISFFMYFDYIISQILSSMSKHLNITRHLYGYHNITWEVTGNGTAAVYVRKMFRRLNVHMSLNDIVRIRDCIPESYSTETHIYYETAGYIIMWILLNIFEGFILRSRRLICSFYYRTREKHRILWLYNRLLRIRKKNLNYRVRKGLVSKKKQHKNMKLEGRLDVEQHIEVDDGDAKCFLCQEEPVNPITCDKCRIRYCKQCYDALSRVCLRCSSWKVIKARLEGRHQEHLLKNRPTPSSQQLQAP